MHEKPRRQQEPPEDEGIPELHFWEGGGENPRFAALFLTDQAITKKYPLWLTFESLKNAYLNALG